MIFTPDDKILCPFCRPNGLDLITGRPCQAEKIPPLSWETHTSFSPDGRWMLLSAYQGTLLWDRQRGEIARKLSATAQEMVFFPDGKSVLSNDGSLQRLDLAMGQPLWTDTFAWGHVNEVVTVAFSEDGRRLISASTDGTLRLWDTTTGQALRWRVHAPGSAPFHAQKQSGVLALSRDGRHILSAVGTRLQLWDASADKAVRSLVLPRPEGVGIEQHVYQVWINSDGTRGRTWFGVPLPGPTDFGRSSPELADKIAEWDLRTGKLITSRHIKWAANAVSPDRRMVLVNGRLVDTASERELVRLEGTSQAGQWTFAPDCSLIIGEVTHAPAKRDIPPLAEPARLRVWETATGKAIADLDSKLLTAQVLISPGNRYLVTNDTEGVLLRHLPTGEVASRLPLPERVLSAEPAAVTQAAWVSAATAGFSPRACRTARFSCGTCRSLPRRLDDWKPRRLNPCGPT